MEKLSILCFETFYRLRKIVRIGTKQILVKPADGYPGIQSLKVDRVRICFASETRGSQKSCEQDDKSGFQYISGEVGEKIKKVYRACEGDFSTAIDGIKKEIGDCLWYLAFLCSSLNIEFEDVAQINLKKLSSRKNRGVLKGNGDNR